MKTIVIMLLAAGILSCVPDAEQPGQTEQPWQTEQPGQTEQEREWEQLRATFEAEKAAWKAQGIRSYRFTAKSTYYIPDTIPITVTVLPEMEPEVTPVIGSIQDQEIWERVMKMEIRKTVPFFPFVWVTIDDYYDNIQWTELSINSVIIQYNQEYHYPEKHISPDGLFSEFEITHFEVLGE